LVNQIQNEEYDRAIYDRLMKLDISQFNFANRPLSNLYDDMRCSNIPATALFFRKI